jgi:hypothetical protein
LTPFTAIVAVAVYLLNEADVAPCGRDSASQLIMRFLGQGKSTQAYEK